MGQNIKQQMIAGAFVTIGSVIVLVSIFFLGGDRLLFKKQSLLKVEFKEVQGLATGSVVSFAGINVGNIKSIEYQPSSQTVELILSVDSDSIKRMTEDTVAEVRTQGALGDKYIYLIPGSPDLPSLKDGSKIKSNDSSGIIEVISQRGGEAEKVFEIIHELHRVAKALNKDNRSEEIFKNLTEASRDLRSVASESKVLLTKLNQEGAGSLNSTLQKLDRVVTKIDQGQGTLGALINDPSLHQSLKSLLAPDTRQQTFRSVIRDSIKGE